MSTTLEHLKPLMTNPWQQWLPQKSASRQASKGTTRGNQHARVECSPCINLQGSLHTKCLCLLVYQILRNKWF